MPGDKNEKIVVTYGQHMYFKNMPYAYKHSQNINNEFQNYIDIQDLLRKKLLDAEVTNQRGIRFFTETQ
jgi:hypothetical protein